MDHLADAPFSESCIFNSWLFCIISFVIQGRLLLRTLIYLSGACSLHNSVKSRFYGKSWHTRVANRVCTWLEMGRRSGHVYLEGIWKVSTSCGKRVKQLLAQELLTILKRWLTSLSRIEKIWSNKRAHVPWYLRSLLKKHQEQQKSTDKPTN